ncbi:MAG: hypothetical protein ACRCX4_15115 [Bacteroidales bacterium]
MIFNHKRLLLFCFAVFFILPGAFAENQNDKNAKNAVYLDIMGIGGWYSLNYERILYSMNRLNLGVSAGVSANHLKDFTGTFNPDWSFPVSVNAFYGRTHHVEFGLGSTFASVVRANSDYDPERGLNINLGLTLGYRYQKPGGGFMFRAAYTPIIPVYRKYSEEGGFKNWLSVSVGYSF